MNCGNERLTCLPGERRKERNNKGKISKRGKEKNYDWVCLKKEEKAKKGQVGFLVRR